MEIKRSKRKTIAIKITADAKVVVFAPYLCHQKKIIDFVKSKEDWINKHLEKRTQWLNAHPEPTEEEIKLLRKRAKEELPPIIKYYSELTGLYPKGVKITSAKKRFGSCSGQNSICFSLYLMQYPIEAIEYVVLHELAHIKHKNHGAEFYKTIEKYMPDYKYRKTLLK